MSEVKIDQSIINQAKELAVFLEGAKAKNVMALDVSSTCVWTDCFVIATYNSAGHLMGLLNEMSPWLQANNLVPASGNTQKKQANEWLLIDLGTIVVHLFSDQARSHYELEKLWYSADVIYQSS